MFGQHWFIDKMKALNYPITDLDSWDQDIGECFGVSNMAIQAFFANDMQTFRKRLETINQIPLEEFAFDFKKLREKRERLIAAGYPEEAAALNQTIVDIYAFFDGVALTQSPNNYLLGNDYLPFSTNQDVRRTRLLTLPSQFDEKGHPNKPEIIASFASAYTKNELIEYIQLLKNSLGKQSFALNLCANRHAITLAYEAETARWLLIDANALPDKEYIESKQLADALWSALLNESREILVMGSSINVRSSDCKDMQSAFYLLQKSKSWKTIHCEDKMNRNYYYSPRGSWGRPSWIENTQTVEDIPSLKDFDFLSMLIKRQEYEIAAELIIDKKLSYSNHYDFNKIFLNIVPVQQNNLLKSLSTEEKIDLIESETSIWQHLPETERIHVFLRLAPFIRNKCLTELSTDNPLYNRLSDLSTLIQQSSKWHQAVTIDETLKSLFLTLRPDDKQALIDALYIDPKSQMTFFLLLHESHRLSIFANIDMLAQSTLLVQLHNEHDLLAVWSTLINSLNEKQKACLINDAQKNSYAIFSSLTQQSQLSLFNQLTPQVQVSICIKSSPDEQASLISTLSLEQKIACINQGKCYESVFSQLIIKIFASATEQEQLSIFSKIDENDTKFFILKKFINSPDTTQLTALIQTQSYEKNLSLIIDNIWPSSSNEQLMIHLFENIPINMREKAYIELTKQLYSRAPLVKLFMPLLTKEQQFSIIYLCGCDVHEHLSLSDMKKIILYKIDNLTLASPSSANYFFKPLRIKIESCDNKDQALDVLFELISFLEESDKPTTLIHSSAELTNEDLIAKTPNLTLTELLQPLGLTKETLTSTSIKRAYLKIHPDTALQSNQNTHQFLDDIKILQAFMSVNGLVHYQEDKEFHHKVTQRLSGITPDDELCLLEHSINGIEKELIGLKCVDEYMNSAKKLIAFTLHAYKTQDLTYKNTLDMLSLIARTIANPEKAQDFFEHTKPYHKHISQSLQQSAEQFIENTLRYLSSKTTSPLPQDVQDRQPSSLSIKKIILNLKSSDDTDIPPINNLPQA